MAAVVKANKAFCGWSANISPFEFDQCIVDGEALVWDNEDFSSLVAFLRVYDFNLAFDASGFLGEKLKLHNYICEKIMSYIFTSESVSGGHPDKVCDQISDAILDAYLAEDPNSRVACETMIKNNMVFIAGEITSMGSPDLEPVVRKTINDIGYNCDEYVFNGDTCEFTNLVFEQSPDISQGVTEGEGENLEQGAGDQGLMFGYACTETESLMPLPIDLSHRLVKKQADVMKSGVIKWLRPDAKSQVSVIYSEDGKTIEGLSPILPAG